ncbi:MAG: glycosyltransferase involved in cell wall biosynthesis [Verrucomicrobiales bacterium]|jgi:glycosyltransferase involved in cell wall biosynthesis
MESNRTSALASIGFFVGEVPCPPFIATLVNGIAQSRSVVVFGADAGGRETGFVAGVVVEKWPRSRLKRLFSLVSGFLKLAITDAEACRRLWRYAAVDGWRLSVNRLIQGLPLMIHRPDIVHVQWAKSLRQVMEMRELYSFPIVLSLRGTQITSSPLADTFLRRRYEEDFPMVEGFHAVCHSIKNDAIRLGAPAERVSVVYSGASDELLDLPLVPLKKPLKPLRVLSVGRIHWKKGYHWALDAVAEFQQTHAIEYRIIAGGPDEELRWQIAELGLQDSVRFLSRMTRAEVLIEMRETADVLLVPSVDEGIANVAIEAMAVGLPVIATHCAGMPELIADGETGLLCDVWTPGSMSRVLQTFASMSVEDRESMRSRARSSIKDSRTVQALFSQMIALYDRVGTGSTITN